MTSKFSNRLSEVSLFALLIMLSGLSSLVRAADQQDDLSCENKKVSVPYRLRVGDQIQIFYRFTPEYNQTATILPDGNVALQIVGRVYVAGRELEEARLAIQAEAAKRLNDPELSLTINDMVRDHFDVVGEVEHPGRFDLRGCTNAVEAIAMAGGLKSSSAKKKVVMVHRLATGTGYGEPQFINFAELSRGRSKAVPLVQNGDVLLVGVNGLTEVERILHLPNFGLYYGLQ